MFMNTLWEVFHAQLPLCYLQGVLVSREHKEIGRTSEAEMIGHFLCHLGQLLVHETC